MSRQTGSTEGDEVPAGRSAQRLNGSTAQRKNGTTIRMGLMYVSGLRAEAAETIERERRKRPFRSVDDFVGRAGLRKPELDVLAEIGALNSIGKKMHRRKALWQIEKAWGPKGPLLEGHREHRTSESGRDQEHGRRLNGSTVQRLNGQ